MRTLIVGDIHGCAAELDALLDAVAFGSGDRLISVGDLVARGPDTLGVLACIRSVGGRAVRGNHEQRLLDVRRARQRGKNGPRLGPGHETLFEQLTDEAWALLEALPLWLELPEHEARVVHAGVVPGLAMPEQDPWALLHMRSLRDGEPSDKRAPVLWAAHYHQGPHVVFGHNAVDGLQLCANATGLDTGCVYGGALTGLLLADGQRIGDVEERRAQLHSVPARKAYVKY